MWGGGTAASVRDDVMCEAALEESERRGVRRDAAARRACVRVKSESRPTPTRRNFSKHVKLKEFYLQTTLTFSAEIAK